MRRHVLEGSHDFPSTNFYLIINLKYYDPVSKTTDKESQDNQLERGLLNKVGNLRDKIYR